MWLYLLFPFTLIFQFLTNRRRRKFLKNQISNYSAPVPVIVVGNINIGGTGKTPLVRYIASALADEGFSPGIVSRGYGGNFKDTLELPLKLLTKYLVMRPNSIKFKHAIIFR